MDQLTILKYFDDTKILITVTEQMNVFMEQETFTILNLKTSYISFVRLLNITI